MSQRRMFPVCAGEMAFQCRDRPLPVKHGLVSTRRFSSCISDNRVSTPGMALSTTQSLKQGFILLLSVKDLLVPRCRFPLSFAKNALFQRSGAPGRFRAPGPPGIRSRNSLPALNAMPGVQVPRRDHVSGADGLLWQPGACAEKVRFTPPFPQFFFKKVHFSGGKSLTDRQSLFFICQPCMTAA